MVQTIKTSELEFVAKKLSIRCTSFSGSQFASAIPPRTRDSGLADKARYVNFGLPAARPLALPTRPLTRRWRIVNAGSARFYRLGLEGHRLTLIGTDGGQLAAPLELDEALMVPGDRLDLLITGTATPRTRTSLMNLPYSRGHGDGVEMPTAVLDIAYGAIAPVSTAGIMPRTITFDETTDAATGASTFTIDGASYPNVPPVEARVGGTPPVQKSSNDSCVAVPSE